MSHDAQVVVFASQKGGSGKTTLSGHIAVQAQLSGAGPVALIDTDPQGSMSKWWNARESEMPFFAKTSIELLERDIRLLKESGVKLIVIDTPPAVTHAITEVISHADLVVIPTRPSPHDLRAVGVTVDLVEQQNKPLIFTVNCATARARITSETAVSLSQHGTVAPTTVHNRVDFAASMIDGRTVSEVNPNSRSAKEIATLWSYLAERLRRLKPESSKSAQPGSHFEVELLTPIKASPVPQADLREEDEVEVIDDILPSVAADIVDRIEQPKAPQREMQRSTELLEAAQKAVWAGIDRRRADAGPPPGIEDRRRASRTFGLRNAK